MNVGLSKTQFKSLVHDFVAVASTKELEALAKQLIREHASRWNANTAAVATLAVRLDRQVRKLPSVSAARIVTNVKTTEDF